MSRNLLQDMVKVKAPAREQIKRREPEKVLNNFKKDNQYQIQTRNKKPKYKIFLVAIVAVIFLLFALSFLFSEARINIIPKVKEIPLNNENLSATKDSNTPGLSFDLVVISGEENKNIQGGEVKEVELVAKGTALIFNSYSSTSQTLAIGSKLEGSNGKIYKTNKKIVIPGIKNGKPGSIEVGIYGAGAGEEYNSSPIDFKILAFKGTAKYSKFYGRSKGEITGGFKGKISVVSLLDKTNTVNELKANLETKLLKKVTDQVPNGFILFKDAIFLDVNENKDITFVPNKDDITTVKVKGSLYGFLFNEKKLAKKIAEDIVEKYDGSEIYIQNIKDLKFSLKDKENISFADVKNIDFSLSGTPKVVWKVNEEKLVIDILGKKKKDFKQILTLFPSIDSAELVIRPFWKTSFPDKSKSIQVIVNYPK